jgi:hypothetical protein
MSSFLSSLPAVTSGVVQITPSPPSLASAPLPLSPCIPVTIDTPLLRAHASPARHAGGCCVPAAATGSVTAAQIGKPRGCLGGALAGGFIGPAGGGCAGGAVPAVNSWGGLLRGARRPLGCDLGGARGGGEFGYACLGGRPVGGPLFLDWQQVSFLFLSVG